MGDVSCQQLRWCWSQRHLEECAVLCCAVYRRCRRGSPEGSTDGELQGRASTRRAGRADRLGRNGSEQVRQGYAGLSSRTGGSLDTDAWTPISCATACGVAHRGHVVSDQWQRRRRASSPLCGVEVGRERSAQAATLVASGSRQLTGERRCVGEIARGRCIPGGCGALFCAGASRCLPAPLASTSSTQEPWTQHCRLLGIERRVRIIVFQFVGAPFSPLIDTKADVVACAPRASPRRSHTPCCCKAPSLGPWWLPEPNQRRHEYVQRSLERGEHAGGSSPVAAATAVTT